MLVDTVSWNQDCVRILDQTRLPRVEEYLDLRTLDSVIESIRELKVRGAPAIGITAAFALRLVAQNTTGKSVDARLTILQDAAHRLIGVRPTAVNLKWAVERVLAKVKQDPTQIDAIVAAESDRIKEEDIYWNRQIGMHGHELLQDGDSVLTHCNTGGLATGGYGTALGVIKTAVEKGKRIHVYVDETRPLLQGARLTAWELSRAGITHDVLCDNAAASLLMTGKIACVLVGADRIARNGDTANKIGTYGLAILAHHHQVPFYVAAPSSTVDHATPTGRDIPIEMRPAYEVGQCGGREQVPEGTSVYNPAFDVTPSKLITAIITESGVRRGPTFSF